MSSLLWRVIVLPLQQLREHEEVDHERLAKLFKELMHDGFLRYPLLVDASTFIILDGHHRFWALKLLGAKLAPVYLVDYMSDKIKVLSWRKGWHVDKKLVLEAGLSGRKLPPKTSRHVLIGVKIPRIDWPLEKLGVKRVVRHETRASR